eukprot:COSAG05_NODE_25693_length_194_cov_71.010526_1_plen_48_part_01
MQSAEVSVDTDLEVSAGGKVDVVASEVELSAATSAKVFTSSLELESAG